MHNVAPIAVKRRCAHVPTRETANQSPNTLPEEHLWTRPGPVRLPILLALAEVPYWWPKSDFKAATAQCIWGSPIVLPTFLSLNVNYTQAYETDLRLTPNVASYLLMVPLLSVASAPKVQSSTDRRRPFGSDSAAWFALRAHPLQ